MLVTTAPRQHVLGKCLSGPLLSSPKDPLITKYYQPLVTALMSIRTRGRGGREGNGYSRTKAARALTLTSNSRTICSEGKSCLNLPAASPGPHLDTHFKISDKITERANRTLIYLQLPELVRLSTASCYPRLGEAGTVLIMRSIAGGFLLLS